MVYSHHTCLLTSPLETFAFFWHSSLDEGDTIFDEVESVSCTTLLGELQLGSETAAIMEAWRIDAGICKLTHNHRSLEDKHDPANMTNSTSCIIYYLNSDSNTVSIRKLSLGKDSNTLQFFAMPNYGSSRQKSVATSLICYLSRVCTINWTPL